MKISHAYMYIGQNNTKKILFAKDFAKTILCGEEVSHRDGVFDSLDNSKMSQKLRPYDSLPCNSCKSCIQFDSLNNPDFTIIDVEPKENSIKIEQIRNMIQRVYEKPIVSKRKVYIINNAEKMTKEAGNCLLKTLEEPPEYVTIILIVFSEGMVLPTIRSRCQKVVFKESEDNEYFSQNTELFRNVDNIFEDSTNLLEFLEKCKVIRDNKDNIYDILEYMNIIFIEKLKQNMDNVNTNKYIECIKLVEQTKNRLKRNANFDMSIDNLLFNIYRKVNA